jgi:hypothetical protein
MCLSETQCELKFGLLIKELPHMVLPMHGLVMPVVSLSAIEND